MNAIANRDVVQKIIVEKSAIWDKYYIVWIHTKMNFY